MPHTRLQDAGQNCKTLNVVFFPHTNTKLNGHPNVVVGWLLDSSPTKKIKDHRANHEKSLHEIHTYRLASQNGLFRVAKRSFS